MNTFNQLFIANVPPQYRPHWVPSTSFPHLQGVPVNSDAERIQRVEQDILIISQRFDADILAMLAQFPKKDNRVPKTNVDVELLIPFPPNRGQAFNIYAAEFMKTQEELKCSVPAAIYL